jgi:hypothetical protein
MNKIKLYRDSLLSILCITSWVVIIFRIFTAAGDENLITKFVWTWIITISIGIIGGMALHLYGVLKRRTLKYSFAYNLFGTLNIIAGCLGMTLPAVLGRPTSYIIAASLAVGIVMCKNIYSTIKWINPR